MSLSVKLRGEYVATFRAVEVHLMEMLAAWVPTTPEMEVKLLFGEHIWDCAQHADAFGKRTHELRLPLQHSLSPASGYLEALNRLRSVGPTTERISGLYDGLLPALSGRYRRYLSLTDHLMDAPTVRIIERVLVDHVRMIEQRAELLRERTDLAHADRVWVDRLIRDEAAVEDLVMPAAVALADTSG